MILNNLYTALQLEGLQPFIRRVQKNINAHDIHEMGLETEQHATLMYSEHENHILDVNEIATSFWRKFGDDIRTTKILINELSLFTNNGHDVLKFGVNPKPLQKYHDFFKFEFGLIPTFLDFNPHVTVGYLKEGTGKKYLKSYDTQIVRPNGIKFRVNRMDSNGIETKNRFLITL